MIWTFLQDQILGMKWLNSAIGSLLSALGLDISSRLGGSLQFFLYDVIKITILLCALIFLISYIQSYFPRSAAKRSSAASTFLGPTVSPLFWALLPPSAPVPPSPCSWGSPALACRWASPSPF